MLVTMIAIMLVGFALGIPVAIALALAGLVGTTVFAQLPLIVYAQQLYVSLDSFALVAVPLFILAGNIMEAGGISRRLVEVAKALVGGIKGGLGAACVVTCMIFAAVSGSSVATTFAVGGIMIPALIRNGYPRPFSTSLQATSAELGIIIPPSIPMILYATSAEVSIRDLFIAGFGPGLLVAGALVLLVMLWARFNRNIELSTDRPPLLPALRAAALSLLMPVIILGGIYGGVFTPTEASAVAVFYALAIGLLVHRELQLANLVTALRKSLVGTASIMLIISAAGLFSYLINRAGIPSAVGEWLVTHIDSPVVFLLGVNIFLFIVGMFLETSASIIILAPILAPVAMRFGIDPIHFGIVVIINLAIGMITPPFGVNLFAACQVAGEAIERIIPSLLMFVAFMIVCLVVITYVPALSLFLIR